MSNSVTKDVSGLPSAQWGSSTAWSRWKQRRPLGRSGPWCRATLREADGRERKNLFTRHRPHVEVKPVGHRDCPR